MGGKKIGVEEFKDKTVELALKSVAKVQISPAMVNWLWDTKGVFAIISLGFDGQVWVWVGLSFPKVFNGMK